MTRLRCRARRADFSTTTPWWSATDSRPRCGRTWSTNFAAVNVTPRVTLGTGNVAVQNINTIPGIGANSTSASNILATLSGSVSSITQQLYSPGGANPKFLPGVYNEHWWRSREMDWFV